MTPRPLWRWALCCAALEVHRRTGWRWALRLFGWTVLPAWVCDDHEIADKAAVASW